MSILCASCLFCILVFFAEPNLPLFLQKTLPKLLWIILLSPNTPDPTPFSYWTFYINYYPDPPPPSKNSWTRLCIHTYVRTYIHTYIHIWIHTYIRTRRSKYSNLNIYNSWCPCIWGCSPPLPFPKKTTHTHTRTHIHTHTYIHIHTYVYTHTYIYIINKWRKGRQCQYSNHG